MQSSVKLTLFVLLIVGFAFTQSRAGHHGCRHCGCECDCNKVCRLVKEEKKVTVTCWGVKCEDFCLGGPSHKSCEHCEEVCDPCDEKDPEAPHTVAKPFIWFDWCPSDTAHMFTKKKLMKKTITKKIPSYKWVVEDLCAKCQKDAKSEPVPAGTKLPSPPPMAQVVIPPTELAVAPVVVE